VWFHLQQFQSKSSDCHCGDKQAYSYIDAETTYNKNKFSQLSIDVPLNSVANIDLCESQILPFGLKLSYLLYDNSIFDGSGGKVITGNTDFNKNNTERTSLRDTTPLIYMRIMV
jgi:hypothetical protein